LVPSVLLVRGPHPTIGGEAFIEPIFILLLGAGAYVGWNIGANDTANCIGTAVGCGLLSFRRAAVLVAVFVIIGAMLQGEQVMKTIGKGIVKADLNFLAVCVALICSGFFVTLATFCRIPTSTSQAIVGGVTGIGLAVGADINYAKLIVIAESWLVCPLLVMALSFGLMALVKFILNKFGARSLLFQQAFGRLAILSACYVAYSMGANNAGNAVGPIANLNIVPPKLLLLIGGVSIAVGAITYGEKVADTVGKGITPLDIPSAFVAQISSAFGMHLFSMFGIPVSTSSAIVGAVVGVGLNKSAKSISKKTIMTILIGWVLTPTLAGTLSFVLYRVITYVTG
jgi:PiT family inorganic phosphate transporter